MVDNANGDLHIKSDTCRPVNRGISLPEVTVDWDNAPRTGTLDIGADEFGNGSLIQSFDPRLTNLDDVYLSPAQPNPFNPHTLVQYGITNAGSGKPFECAVFSTSGKLIRMLKRGAAIAGNYALQWDAKDDNGVQVASGAYVIKLVAGGKSVTTNVVFMK
ncbi:MAG: hypothetical protein A2519_22430 [Candidatus Raymondbacteria bacterium RIFOXYD12_FULL_49_13]|uniref:FlgD/Vpr Ig-like domain-containing protein n=1 Tax=Candidatus Raymondbacteria bacterium RIFOXYD12_FULL_49_13 TaxID=1817890 RepID=A0A1F7F3S2_UNCRA|nr:MAG: hypothetical protein A2519_22430 [Candidatus Raymondbacteria bacterium RIFOXYD12_FULL_49_13]